MDVDVVIAGTGLSESILAAALSKAGFSIAHLDENPYYGGDDASLSLDDLAQWAHLRTSQESNSVYTASQRSRFTSISFSTLPTPQSRQFSISLSPTIVPSVGPLVDSLIASGVSRYGGFKLLERVAVYDSPGLVKSVPGTKEDVFKSSELSLLDKRRLMRFLLFANGEFETKQELVGREASPFLQYLREVFSLNEQVAIAVVYALAFCVRALDPTLPALQRIRRYLRSAGRYGPSPFLVGHYGGIGEIAQGFCRVSAVQGGIYILGREILSTSEASEEPTDLPPDSKRFTLSLQDIPEKLRCNILIASSDYLPVGSDTDSSAAHSPSERHSIARCLAVLRTPVVFRDTRPTAPPVDPAISIEKTGELGVDTALLIFPPSAVEGGSTTTAVQLLITGEESLSAPKDHWILHFSVPLFTPVERTAEEILRPYLDASLSLTSPNSDVSPVLVSTLFYIQHPSPTATQHPFKHPSVVTSTNTTVLSEFADAATVAAEQTFWKVVEMLKGTKQGMAEFGNGGQIENFWPPINDTSVLEQD